MNGLPENAGTGPAVPVPPGRPPAAARALAGHNRVSTQALTSLARAAAAAELGVEPADVRAEWADDAGLLALSLVTPVAVPPLASVSSAADLAPWGGSVWERAARAKGRILESVASLSGALISRVDLRVSGVRVGPSLRTVDRRPAVPAEGGLA